MPVVPPGEMSLESVTLEPTALLKFLTLGIGFGDAAVSLPIDKVKKFAIGLKYIDCIS